MTMPQPLRLVRWTHAQTQALTMIARHGADRVFAPVFGTGSDGCAKPWNIRMSPLGSQRIPWTLSRPDQGENIGGDDYRVVGFEWNGARIWVRSSSRICGDWLAFRMPDLQIETLPPQFVDAAWDAMIQDVLAGLGVARLCPGMRVLADEFPDRQAVYPYAWAVSIRSPDTPRTLHAELVADDAGLQCLGDLLGRMPAPDAAGVSGLLDSLSILVVARAGGTTLTAADVRGLEAGDVVLFDRCLANLGGDVWLATADGQGVRVRACQPGVPRYVVTQEWNSLLMNDYPAPENDYASEENLYPPLEGSYPLEQNSGSSTDDLRSHERDYVPGQNYYPAAGHANEAAADSPPAPDPMPSPGPGGEGPDVDRIPVRLVFDLGEHKMTLGDLRRLRLGEFFDLQRPIDAGPVHIRANGTLIGTAELVDIDGRIGARVLTLIPGRDSWG